MFSVLWWLLSLLFHNLGCVCSLPLRNGGPGPYFWGAAGGRRGRTPFKADDWSAWPDLTFKWWSAFAGFMCLTVLD